jgi:hypothetical protein
MAATAKAAAEDKGFSRYCPVVQQLGPGGGGLSPGISCIYDVRRKLRRF